jgi:subtilisin family serine protease
VLGVYPDVVRSLQTTRTPEFLGLNTMLGLWPQAHFGDDVIVGVFDSGVWPERESFSDVGYGPIPTRWNGTCQTGTDWNATNCNKKLIGARYFYAGYEQATGPLNETVESRSARDTDGHGTHTASTAAGSPVEGANLNGFANGTARGMAPKARIAVYKICWTGGCITSDILPHLNLP